MYIDIIILMQVSLVIIVSGFIFINQRNSRAFLLHKRIIGLLISFNSPQQRTSQQKRKQQRAYYFENTA